MILAPVAQKIKGKSQLDLMPFPFPRAKRNGHNQSLPRKKGMFELNQTTKQDLRCAQYGKSKTVASQNIEKQPLLIRPIWGLSRQGLKIELKGF